MTVALLTGEVGVQAARARSSAASGATTNVSARTSQRQIRSDVAGSRFLVIATAPKHSNRARAPDSAANQSRTRRFRCTGRTSAPSMLKQPRPKNLDGHDDNLDKNEKLRLCRQAMQKGDKVCVVPVASSSDQSIGPESSGPAHQVWCSRELYARRALRVCSGFSISCLQREIIGNRVSLHCRSFGRLRADMQRNVQAQNADTWQNSRRRSHAGSPAVYSSDPRPSAGGGAERHALRPMN